MIKVTVETDFVKCEIEQEGEDIYELYDLFARAAMGVGFQKENIDNVFKEYVEHLIDETELK